MDYKSNKIFNKNLKVFFKHKIKQNKNKILLELNQ